MNKCDLPALITALGGRQALQDLLGVGASAVSNYLARGELPRHAHAPVCAALEARGYHVDPGSLAIIGRGDGVRGCRRVRNAAASMMPLGPRCRWRVSAARAVAGAIAL